MTDPKNRQIPMRRYLPQVVIDSMRDRFYAGVKAAEVRFPYNAAEEDALTGALSQAIIEPGGMTVQTAHGEFRWMTVSHKLRGRGPGAPEARIGADGIFSVRSPQVGWFFAPPQGPPIPSQG